MASRAAQMAAGLLLLLLALAEAGGATDEDSAVVFRNTAPGSAADKDEAAGEPTVDCAHRATGLRGECLPLPRCASAVRERLQDRSPQLCGFASGFTLIPDVCCPVEPQQPPDAAQRPPTGGGDAEQRQPDHEPGHRGDHQGQQQQGHRPAAGSCAAFNASSAARRERRPEGRPGSVARRMCLQYQRDICSGRVDRTDRTMQSAFGAFFNPADLLEYPHMALLGYGDVDEIEYKCGGTLIAPDFVLTAAHCITDSTSRVRWVLLGALNRTQSPGEARTRQLIEVAEAVTHPEYSVRARYHDVALLRLASPAALAVEDVRPACLHTELDADDRGRAGELAVVTGWGAEEFGGEGSERLLKGNVTVRQLGDCRALDSRLPRGLDERSHICAGGDGTNPTDACQGDSGGPLQFPALESDPGCLYRVAGVVSFGPPCGLGAPGVYARVASYVPWIESVVWQRRDEQGGQGVCLPDTGPGTVARRACQQYLRRFCPGVARAAVPGLRRQDRCHFQERDARGGARFEFAQPAEFPHQVLLRYGQQSGQPVDEVACAGSLISPRFVLTAAHCAVLDCAGPVREVLLGVEVRSSPPLLTVAVEAVVVHPDFDAALRYNDVALLRLAEAVPARLQTRPACLHTDGDGPAIGLLASGLTAEGPWDSVYGEVRKARLEAEDAAACSPGLGPDARLPRGLLDSQLCARGRNGAVAPGEAGAPLQSLAAELDGLRVHRVAGVLSLAAPCGSGRPDVYTRVAAFVPWIESVVWPDER